MSKKVKRLFELFQPEHYNIELSVNKATMSFEGKVSIVGKKTGPPSQRITLHQKDLQISKATIVKHDEKASTSIKVSRVQTHKAYNEVRLHTANKIYAGKYTVTLEFRGAITKQMNGLYPCYFENDGQEQIILATQFESHHAREVFPCIDEPEAKATFDLSIQAPKNEVVIANTPIKSTSLKDQLQTTVFETTPIMSSYLLAFIIGNLKYSETTTKSGVTIRAWTTPEKVNQTDFALDLTVKCIEFYNEYFAIPYPLAKCDIIALPDFASGAMENWGAITFREQCMLVDPANTSLPNKQYVAMVVAHELAHQWFGNLVTMRWWTDLWLNEGFASWIEYLAVDHIFPEWDMWTQYIADEQQVALKLDALEHTHPIEVPVNHPDEIRTIFDTISYNKGSSVIHMLNNYLGNDVFRDGLRFYLKKHSYKNTNTVDLWEALELISGKPVTAFMNTWTSQPGYPIVHVNVIDDRRVDINQEKFLLNKSNSKALQTTIWPIPILPNQIEQHSELENEFGVYQFTSTDSLKINAGQSGYYRTVYNTSHLKRLSELIRRGKMQPLDRLGILADAFEAAKAGESNTDEALILLEAYRHEDNVAVWDVIASNIAETRMVLNSDELRDAMKPFVRKLVKKQLNRLGWIPKKTDTHFDLLLRPTILGMAAAADEPSVVAECQRLFREMKRPEDIAPDLRGVVWNTVARLGGTADFNKMLRMHNDSSNSEVRTTLSSAITGFKQPSLHKKAFAMITSSEVRLQDAAYWIAYSFTNRYSRAAAWQWMKNNWHWLESNLGSDLSFSRFPIFAARVNSSNEFLKSFEEFFANKRTPALERSINQGVEIIQWHTTWRERAYKEVLAFFRKAQ